jgi:hypothetical protein
MGLFDGAMFDPQNSGPNGQQFSQQGLLALLSQIAKQPAPSGALPGQPGSDAQASGGGIVPPQPGTPPGAPQPQGAPMQQQGQPMPGAGGGFMNGLQSFLGNHSNALMGLGAGIASGGLSHGVSGMTQGNQQDYQRQMQMMSMQMGAQALRARGVPESQIPLILLNSDFGKAYAGNYGPQTSSVVGVKSPTGVESSALLQPQTDPLRQTAPSLTSVNPQNLTPTNAAPGATSGLPPSQQLQNAPMNSVIRAGQGRYIKTPTGWMPYNG